MKQLTPDHLFHEDRLTPLTQVESAFYLQEGWRRATGQDPTQTQLSCLWSQFNVETAAGAKVHCWNYGNIKKTSGHTWTMYPCHEYLADGTVQKFYPPHIQTGFNAYADPVAGAQEYIEFLKNKPRYTLAWQALMQNQSLTKFNHELKKGGYYTAPEDKYLKALKTYHVKFAKIYTEMLTYHPPQPEPKLETPEVIVEQTPELIELPSEPKAPEPTIIAQPETPISEPPVEQITKSPISSSWWVLLLSWIVKFFRQ